MKRLAMIVATALMVCSCGLLDEVFDDGSKDYDKNHGKGKPSAANVWVPKKYIAEKNASGLLTKILEKKPVYNDNHILTGYETVTLAEFSYSDDTAIMRMESIGPDKETVIDIYHFYFGSNGCAYKGYLEDAASEPGERDNLYFSCRYDKSGHLIHYNEDGDKIAFTWKNGNIESIHDQFRGNNNRSTITYTGMTNFDEFGVSRFLLENWGDDYYRIIFLGDIEYAIYAGFFGKQLKNLPNKVTYTNEYGSTYYYQYIYEDYKYRIEEVSE